MSEELAPEAETEPDEAGLESSDDGLYGCVVTEFRGERTLHVESDRWLELALELLADGWNMCLDVTAVDYLTYAGRRQLPEGIVAERFEVVALFMSHQRAERIRAKAQVSAEDPTIASLYAVYPGIDYLEREVYDLMGIIFEGHPDLSRILMPEGWQGHPLRKDYAVNAIPVQFKVEQP